jgi:hypothetical protein
MLFTMRIKGTFAEAKATLDSSLGMIERFNEHLWEAENHRVRGEVALDAGQFKIRPFRGLQLSLDRFPGQSVVFSVIVVNRCYCL